MKEEDFESMIRQFWLIKHGGRRIRWKQHGGGRVEVDGHPINYRESVDGSSIIITAGDQHKYSQCFALSIYPDTKIAVLQTVSRRNDCFVDGHNNSRDLVRAAYMIAKERGMRAFEFTDLSYIVCPGTVNLSDLSFLTTGQTWYESILPGLTCIDQLHNKTCYLLDEYRQRVRTNTWRQVGHSLIDLDMHGVDIDAPGSAMLVLAALKREKQFCWFFDQNMDQLILNSGYVSMHGRQWMCKIEQPMSNWRRRTTRRATSSARRSTQRR
jgi:hypothetical protein